MDPRLGTDTSGPGEAVFAIRFIGKPQILLEFEISGSEKKSEKIKKSYYAQTLIVVVLTVVKLVGFFVITRNQ